MPQFRIPGLVLILTAGLGVACSTSEDGNLSMQGNAVEVDPSMYNFAVTPPNVDTDGDMVPDGIGLDLDGDLVADVVVVDQNGDGIGDAVLQIDATGTYQMVPVSPSAGSAGAPPVVVNTIPTAGSGSGGAPAVGGAGAPAAAAGGTAVPAQGGSPAAGGAAPGAAGMMAAMAGTGAGGGPPVVAPPGDVPADYARGRSAGCGKPLPDGQVERERFRTDIAMTEVNQEWLDIFNKDASEYMDRNFSVKVPAFYDPNNAYTVNIIGGGCGGDGQGYGGQAAWPDNNDSTVIHVHPNYKGGCYEDDGANNPEEAFFDVYYPLLLERYCIDTERVFITGYSSGAWHAITLGCARSKYIRGHAQTIGGLRARRSECQGPVAAWFLADVLDTGNPIHDVDNDIDCVGTEEDGCYRGKQICTGYYDENGDRQGGCVDEGTALARDRALERNGCIGKDTVPWGGTLDGTPIEQGGVPRYPTFIRTDPGEPVPQDAIDAVSQWFPVSADGLNTIPACVKYTGCPEMYPVVFCNVYDDGHTAGGYIQRTAQQEFFEQDVPRYPQ